MILKIRDVHAFARDVAIDNGTLIFARMITGGQEARAIAYFAAHKGGYADAQPHLGWVHIQPEATRVQIESIFAQGIAQKIVTLYLPAMSGRYYFVARQDAVESRFRCFLHACTPYPIPRRLPPPERWGEALETYESQCLVALAFHETVQRDAADHWYACFACEVASEPLPFNELAVGIDVGLERFATLSDGVKVENPRFFRRNEKALAKAQRKLSQAEKGTPQRAKQRKAIQHIHQRIANKRRDFAHKLSREWVSSFGMIAFEKLNGKNMLQNHCLAKSISDAAWHQLIAYTTYKAENAGRVVVLVDPRNTSQQCSCCGTMVEKSLSVRVHACPACGLVMDRDQNAAINILGLGLQSLGIALEAPAFRRGE
jgi:putative transposase